MLCFALFLFFFQSCVRFVMGWHGRRLEQLNSGYCHVLWVVWGRAGRHDLTIIFLRCFGHFHNNDIYNHMPCAKKIGFSDKRAGSTRRPGPGAAQHSWCSVSTTLRVFWFPPFDGKGSIGCAQLPLGVKEVCGCPTTDWCPVWNSWSSVKHRNPDQVKAVNDVEEEAFSS